MLDPKRDLVGATPETLAKALFRRVESLRPRSAGKSVVGDQVAVEKVATDKPGLEREEVPMLVRTIEDQRAGG